MITGDKKFLDVCKNFIWLIFLGIISYLFLASIFSTSVIGELVYVKADNKLEYIGEHTFYISDQFLVQIMFILGVLMLGIWCYRLYQQKGQKIRLDRLEILILSSFCLLGIVFIANTNLYPRSDQEMVLRIATDMRNGDFTKFSRGEYMYMCPNQQGIVFTYFLLSFLFQENTYIALQYLNVFFAAGIIYLLGKMMKMVYQHSMIWVGILSICFLPLFFYTTFVYGTLPSFFFALLAIYLELKCWNTGKARFGVAASISIAISIMLKSNSIIFLIAMILYWIYMMIHTGKWLKHITIGILLLIFPICIQSGINFFMSQYTGYSHEGGIPNSAYIAMGLQDNHCAAGWWNGYNWDVYRENNYDTELANNQAKENIKKSVQNFSNNKKQAVSFYVKKILSQWNNPTFQSFDIISYRKAMGNTPSWIQSIYTGWGRHFLSGYMNCFQSLMLAGVLLYLIYNVKHATMAQTFFALCFVGGFMFHLLWEAKCQYAFPYNLLLIPYAAVGFRSLFFNMSKLQLEKIKDKKRIMKYSIIAALGTIAVLLLSTTSLFKKVVAVDRDNAIYTEYLDTIERISENPSETQEDYVMRQYIDAK